MTLISFVVPAYRVQGYLRECLDSICGQPGADIEVIGVDDCSPDSSGEILAEYARRDPRVRVVSLPANSGLGAARNAGLAEARGEYVWFVDGDDWLAEGCLRPVAERLAAVRPDVLIVDHVRVDWRGAAGRSAMSEVLTDSPGTRVFALRERPEVIRLLHTAWNKVVRRDILTDLGIGFADGWYEDVSFTYPLLMSAERISVLDRVCVNYRQRLSGAITGTPSARHFEIFEHWQRVHDHLEGLGAAGEPLRPYLFERMIWHYLIVLGNGRRVPAALRRAFFERIVADYRRRLPPGGYPVASRADQLKHRLVAAGQWHTFAALRVAGRAGRGLPRTREIARRGRTLLLREYYRAQLRLPIEPDLAIFSAYWYRGYACNPAAIHAKLRELAPGVRGLWVVRRDLAGGLPADVDHVVAGTPAYYRALARARWLVNNVNFPDWVVKRAGSVHVQTHHGSPVKVMGLDQQRYPAGAPGMNFDRMLRRVQRWDYSISSNTFSSQMWERAYPGHYAHLEVGYPRNDRLVNATAADVAAARRRVGAAPGDRVVLYLPTHREYHRGYRPPFDPRRLLAAIGPRARLLIRGHYLEEADLLAAAPRTPGLRDVGAHPDVVELYLAADVLVTDYSSAMFDYALLDRPIVVYAPDWEIYRLARGVYFDLLAEPPGAVAITFDDLVALFARDEIDSPAAAAARQEFRRRFCHLDDGRAAERVVRQVFLTEPA